MSWADRTHDAPDGPPPRRSLAVPILLLLVGLAIPLLLLVGLQRSGGFGSAGAASGRTSLTFRTVPISPTPLWHVAPNRIGPPPFGRSFAVESSDGAYAYAMVPDLSPDQEAASAPESERETRRAFRRRFPERGMYRLDEPPTQLWSIHYLHVQDPARVLVPPDGRNLIVYLDEGFPSQPGGALGFYVDGEGVADRALSRLGRGGRVAGELDLALDEPARRLHVWIRDMGHYVLDYEGTVVESEGLGPFGW